jgi:hypothetical protein
MMAMRALGAARSGDLALTRRLAVQDMYVDPPAALPACGVGPLAARVKRFIATASIFKERLRSAVIDFQLINMVS